VLVTGARQAGKTTLLREEFGKRHRYVSLERLDIRESALADPVAFLEDHPTPIILDEVQHAPELLAWIKDAVDRDRRPGRWLLTGSQSFPLMRGVSETLAGRVAVLRLDPLSSCEVAGISAKDPFARVFGKSRSIGKQKIPDLADWLLRGSYPEIRLNARVDRELWFASYVQTYLERDIRDILQVTDLATFHSFLRLLASRTGQLLNLAELGREAGISAPTARRWTSVLETSHIIHILQPYHRNFGKRMRKSSKLIWMDSGLPTFLLGLRDQEAVLRGPTAGALVENAVVSEWLKALRQRGDTTNAWFWRSAAGLEVDLVLERNGVLHGIEVKATRTPTPRHADSLAKWLELAGEGARGVLACAIDEPRSLRPGIRAVPWHQAW